MRGNLDLLSEARGWWDVVARRHRAPADRRTRPGSSARRWTLLPPEPWDDTVWQRWTAALKAATGRKGKSLFLPLRLALTGEDHGPELQALLPLIGRDRAVSRLQVAAR